MLYASDWMSRWVTQRAEHPNTEKINYLVNEFFIKFLGGAFGSGTALQAGRSRVRFPMVSLEFSLTQSFRPHYGPGVDSMSNRNEYQEYFLGVKAAGA